MARFSDAVQRVKKACRNSLKFNNVYDCTRPLLALMGLFGVGGTWICRRDGVYTLRNSRLSLLVFIFVSLVSSPYYLMSKLVDLFTPVDPPRRLNANIAFIIFILKLFLTVSTVVVGCMMTHVHCERLERILQIITNIDSQLQQANMRVQHWKITLKVAVFALITINYPEIIILLSAGGFKRHLVIMLTFSIQLWYAWTILFLLIIHERFVGLNRLLQENATGSNIQIVGGRNPRDSHMLRRIALARHVHEQLTDVAQLFSGTCRYMILGLVTAPIIDTLYVLLNILVNKEMLIDSVYIHLMRIVALIYICQANKAERRVLNARLRHLVAFETDREIIHQVQQHIMYNAYSTPGLIDFQFTDVDNALWLTIVDVIVSNALVIYSYTRDRTKLN